LTRSCASSAPRPSQSRGEQVRAIEASCGWALQTRGELAQHEPISTKELATLRLFDPERTFTA